MLFEKNKSRSPLALLYLVMFLAVEVMVVVNSQVVVHFDSVIQNVMTPMVTPLRTSMFVLISFLGSPVVSLILASFIAILIYSKKRKVDGIWVMLTYLGGNVIAFLIKEIVRRPRPSDKVVPDSGFSFPSGHIFGLTMLVLIIIYVLLPYIKNQESRFILEIILVIWLLLVAFSRVYLRGHYISDIFGSILLAGTWWKCAELLYLKYYQTVSNFFSLKLKKIN